MTDIKVRLSLVIPGATMLSSQDCEKMSKNEAYNTNLIPIEIEEGKGKKRRKRKENLVVLTRKTINCKQNIAISKYAYEYMTSTNIPSPEVRKCWKNMSKKQRLEYHLNDIANAFNAISFDYVILDD